MEFILLEVSDWPLWVQIPVFGILLIVGLGWAMFIMIAGLSSMVYQYNPTLSPRRTYEGRYFRGPETDTVWTGYYGPKKQSPRHGGPVTATPYGGHLRTKFRVTKPRETTREGKETAVRPTRPRSRAVQETNVLTKPVEAGFSEKPPEMMGKTPYCPECRSQIRPKIEGNRTLFACNRCSYRSTSVVETKERK